MNHFQLLTLTASFDLDWPDSLKNFFQATKPVSEVTTQFLSFDCFIDTRKEDGEEVMRVFYSKMIMMAILPMIIIAISYVVWNIIFLFKRNRPSTISVKPQSNQNPSLDTSLNDTHPSNMLTHSQTLSDVSDQKTGRIVSTIIIVLFLVHPTITTIMFNAFNCQNIDGTNRLYEDLEILCGQGQHKLYSLTIALPSIIIWGLGIPTMAVFMLYQRRKELGVIETKAKFGFLYNGYRIPQAYYWELVIMYRKIIVIFIQVFLAQLGKIVQALTMLLFLILCLTLTAAKQPFANHFLNSLEALSLLSSAVTVYCGLFYIAKASFKKESSFEMTTEAELFLFITIILTHIAFLGYWGYHFLQEIRTTIRKKAPKLYFSLFLCCRKGVLESELQIEDARERMGPMLQTIDRIQEYLHERKMMYVQGQIPWEDEAFKRMVGMCKGYVDRVDRMMAFSIGEGQEKGLSVADLMLDKQRSSSVTKLRPKQQKSMKRKMMGAERLIMALDSEIGSQPRLNDNESQIGFDDDGAQAHQINALPRFESRNELDDQNVGEDDDENGAIDFNDYTLNQLSQEIEASNMTLITKGPFEEKKFPFKRYSQGDLETSQNNKSLLLSGTPDAQSPILQLDLLGGQATFADFKILNSARLMKEAPDFYNHHEPPTEPEIQPTPHPLQRTSTEDAVTILPRSSTKNLSKNKSVKSISSVNSGKIKESRFKRARKEQVMASTAIIALQGFEVISEEDEKVGMPSTQIIQTTREQKGDTLVVNNLLMDEEDSMLEEEMHRALQNV
ncbi:hypothetical protein FGO68_gene5296 [Halteria grandinella]|uniref:TRP C-terminal domain-containing protein n=1 Tax=Halteria grandinella TaxID=5974 RepID=A0A8J8P5X9_HALGN|nr:hypothetical protein FGO68_gene5296 [Halteria grandinella]